jgi:hypothetical protein
MRGAASVAVTLCTAAVIAASAGCSGGPDASPARTHAAFTEGGVAVDVTLERSDAATVAVTATLRPQQAGFHLYSLGLPDQGVDGLGIPTRLSVAAPLAAAGRVTTPARPYDLRPAGLDVKLPVYPDGPVTLQLTARLAPGTQNPPPTATLHLTYGACSSTAGCLAPVRNRALTVPLPRARPGSPRTGGTSGSRTRGTAVPLAAGRAVPEVHPNRARQGTLYRYGADGAPLTS